jgi:mycothiol synthase
MLEIRDFEKSDYPSIAGVYNAAQPEKNHTADGLRHSDSTRDEKCKHRRWVAEIGGRIVGVAEYDQFAGMYHPRKFGVWVHLEPQHENPQNRALLWERVTAALEDFEPVSLLSYGREDRSAVIEFLVAQGFEEKMRYWESCLEVSAFDFSPFAGVQDGVGAAGFEIRTLAQLEREPEYRQKLFELWADCRRDVPRPDEATEISFSQFSKWTFESPYLLPEACFIALESASERWAGMSQLWKGQGDDRNLHTGLTAVRREYRRNKLALAMKLRGIEYARSVNSPEIRTGNESNNKGMLSINEMLGYVKQPAWIDLVKVLREE